MNYFERNGQQILRLWVMLMLLFFVAAGYVAGHRVYEDRISSEMRQQERLDPSANEEGKTAVNSAVLNGVDADNYKEVRVGIYVDRIVEISTKATGWTVDFYIWFNWQGDGIHPGDYFQVIDGEIESKTQVKTSTTLVDGDTHHYALYRVTARITKFFNVVRYPLDNHLLTIRIEDMQHPWHALRYVPDVHGAEYSSRVVVPGYRLHDAQIISKPHAYKTNRGDPMIAADTQAVFSQITYGVKIDRPDWGLYFKMIQGLFASVAIALLAFILGPAAGERIGLGVGAFFAAVGSSYVNLSELPGVGMVTLIDMTNGLTMVTIFLSIMGSVLSSRIAINESQLAIAERFDRISLVIFMVGFTAVNIVMALLASA